MGLLESFGFGAAAAPAVAPGGGRPRSPRGGASGTAAAGERPPYPYRGSAVQLPPTPTADTITPADAWGYSPWWRAVWIIATTIGRTPCHVCTLSADADATPVYDHGASGMLTFRANDEETAQQARCRLLIYAVIHGRALAVPVTTSKGRQLIPILPGTWWPERRDGQKWYVVDVYGPPKSGGDNPNDRQRKFKESEVFHISGLTPDGLLGLATWQAATYALAEGLAGSRVRTTRATNGGRPALALSTDQALPPGHPEKIQADFTRVMSGFEESQIPVVLDRGLKANPLAYAADQSHEAALAALPLRDVANYTGVPVSFLASANRSDNTLETDDLQLSRYGLGWWYDRYEDEGDAKLLEPDQWERRTHAVRFDRQRLEWLDSRGRADLIRAGLAGVPPFKINEVRRKLGLPGDDDPAADRILIPLNVGQGGAANQPPPGGNQPGRPPEKKPVPVATADPAPVAALVRHAAARVTRWVTADARRNAGSARSFMAFVENIRGRYAARWQAEADVVAGFGVALPDIPERVRAELLDLADSATPATLAARVDDLCTRLEADLPDAAAALVVGPLPE